MDTCPGNTWEPLEPRMEPWTIFLYRFYMNPSWGTHVNTWGSVRQKPVGTHWDVSDMNPFSGTHSREPLQIHGEVSDRNPREPVGSCPGNIREGMGNCSSRTAGNSCGALAQLLGALAQLLGTIRTIRNTRVIIQENTTYIYGGEAMRTRGNTWEALGKPRGSPWEAVHRYAC
jgi:hypothetical protein